MIWQLWTFTTRLDALCIKSRYLQLYFRLYIIFSYCLLVFFFSFVKFSCLPGIADWPAKCAFNRLKNVASFAMFSALVAFVVVAHWFSSRAKPICAGGALTSSYRVSQKCPSV